VNFQKVSANFRELILKQNVKKSTTANCQSHVIIQKPSIKLIY